MKRSHLAVFLLAVACALPCCRTLNPFPQRDRGLEDVSPEELRERLDVFGVRFAAHVQAAADKIAHDATDDEIRRQAVVWKARAIGTVRDFLMQQNVQRSFSMCWGFCIQQIQFFEKGDGKGTFGTCHALAVEAAKAAEADVDVIARTLLTAAQADELKAKLVKYAADHPLRGAFAPSSVASSRRAARAAGRGIAGDILSVPLAPFNAVGGIDNTAKAVHEFSIVADRMVRSVNYLPEDTRWQTQLLLYDLNRMDNVKSAIGSFKTLSDSSARLAETAESLPGTLRKEIETTVETLDAKQAGFRETLKEARATLDTAEQTSASLAEAGKAWEGTFTAFDKMVANLSPDPDAPADPNSKPFDIGEYGKTAENLAEAAVRLKELTAEVKTLVGDDAITKRIDQVDAKARTALDHSAVQAEGIVDHMTWRAIQVLIAGFVLLLVYRFAATRFFKTS